MTCLPSAARQSGANALPASLILTQIRDLIYRVAGIFQADSKLGLLQERCQKRMQVLGIASLRDYYECLTVKPCGRPNSSVLLNVITVGKTCFFRTARSWTQSRKSPCHESSKQNLSFPRSNSESGARDAPREKNPTRSP